MEKKIEIDLSGEQLLNHALYNKGSAFTQQERDVFGINGFLPSHISSIELQVARRYQNFISQANHLAKFTFLSSLQNRNEVLFYRLISSHVSEMLPYIYTPTVGDVSLQYSYLYREHRGIYFSYPLRDKVDEILSSLQGRSIQVIVLTDGERILGLGDVGIGGMAIPVGKLSLYTLFGGIHPAATLPVFVDVGTNNPEHLHDPNYLGWRHERITGKEYDAFLERIVKGLKKTFPGVLLQWEDFAKVHAKKLLDRYRDELLSFNDDIQGTAAVVLSAVYATSALTGASLKDQRIAVLGGGSAGLGISNTLLQAMKAEGLSEEEAIKRFYLVDRHGLIHTASPLIEEEQRLFAQNAEELQGWKVKDRQSISLLEVAENAKPTILIGVSTVQGAFTEEIVKAMAKHVERPVILPLSNPTSKSEARPEDLIAWTKGKALIATGSPFPSAEYQSRLYHIAQCNNVYIFPGVGLGVIAARARKVTDRMFVVAAKTLSSHSPMLKDPQATLFPSFETLRSISREIGVAVAECAVEEKVADKLSREQILEAVDACMWFPDYPIYTKKKSL